MEKGDFIMKNIWTKSVTIGVLAFSILGTSTVAASTWTSSQHNVGPGGGWSSYGSPNKKTTNSSQASFYGNALPNSFGYNVWLINSNAARRSGTVGLYKNKTTYAENNTGQRNYLYYADPRSKSYEPNSSTIRLQFSSDRK
jgi:hypothetical protein